MQLTSIDDITTNYRHIFLSPHFNDVVYSCGGTLGVQTSTGLRPLVITVFGGIPAENKAISSLATETIRKAGATGNSATHLMEERRQEDSKALEYLQCDYLWLDFQEAIFRGNPGHYTTTEEVVGGEVHQADRNLDKQLAKLLVDVQSRLPDATWYVPLGIGRHVDHQIVCSAADRLVQQKAKVYYYEDFPYVEGDKEALNKRLQELGGRYEFALVETSEMLPLKVEAADMYTSQISANFSSQEAMHKAIENYAHGIRPVETVCLERYWVEY